MEHTPQLNRTSGYESVKEPSALDAAHPPAVASFATTVMRASSRVWMGAESGIPADFGKPLVSLWSYHGQGVLGEQLAGGNVQRGCYLIDNRDRWVPRAALEIADVGPMYPGFVRKCFLTKALVSAQATQVSGKALTDIHAPLETRLSPIDLQTIRDIMLDCLWLSGMTPV